MALLFVIITYLLNWTEAPESNVVYGVFRNNSLIAETQDTLYVDMTADTGLVYYVYGIRFEAGEAFALSPPLKVLTIDYREGAEAYRAVEFVGESVGNVAILYPSGNWNTSYKDGVLTSVCEFDLTGDGIINLSDFALFAERGGFTLEELYWLFAVYGGPGIYRRQIQ